MSKVYKTDRLHRWAWILFHPLKWYKTRAVRDAVDKKLNDVLYNAETDMFSTYQPKGQVVKAKPSKYNPDTTRRGGRIVKAMPKDLRKMKEAQERNIDPQMPFLPKE